LSRPQDLPSLSKTAAPPAVFFLATPGFRPARLVDTLAGMRHSRKFVELCVVLFLVRAGLPAAEPPGLDWVVASKDGRGFTPGYCPTAAEARQLRSAP
jgi:hypothetical protein